MEAKQILGSGSERRDPDSSDETSLRSELLALIDSWQLHRSSPLDDNSPLISSGFFDSLALFNLTIWIETKIARNIDPGSVDIVKEWDSVGNILRYVQEQLSGRVRVGAKSSRTLALPLATSAYEIRKYAPRYKRDVAEFQTRLWSPDPELNLRYFEWKYETNPYRDGIHIYLAFHDAELVGMRGFYPSRWETGMPARWFDVFVADDLLIREDHRQQALVTRIMQAAYHDLRGSGARYVFNLSGGPLTVIGSLITGWRSAGTLKPQRCRSSAGLMVSAFRKRLSGVPYLGRYAYSRRLSGLLGLDPFVRLDRAINPVTKHDGPIWVDKNPKPKAMAALIKRIGHNGRLRHVRDEQYFSWRFRNPLHEYRFLFIGNEPLHGYLVLKRAINDPSSRLSIVDLEAVDGRVRSALLNRAVSAGISVELVIWVASVDDQTLRQLYELGFSPVSQQNVLSQPHVLIRPVENERLEEDWHLGDTCLLDLKNWDLRMLYSMAG